jgi:hypothetical protein
MITTLRWMPAKKAKNATKAVNAQMLACHGYNVSRFTG